jgi:uncharacterized RDD family membrane protein YckC
VDATDQLTIDTPEQVTLALPIPGIGSRFLAIVIDTLVQVGLGLFVLVVAMVLSTAGATSHWVTFGPALLILFIFSLYWGYFAVFEIWWSGQTPGKRMASIRVIKMTGRPVDPTAVILRNLLRAIDILPAAYGFGVACMLFNRHSRRLGDYVAGTVVVHDRKDTEFDIQWRPAPAPAAPTTTAVALSPDELVLIETYLSRRFDMPQRVSDDSLRRILAVLAERRDVRPEAREDPDKFLERIARDARNASRFQ